jgi:hypothetical protein
MVSPREESAAGQRRSVRNGWGVYRFAMTDSEPGREVARSELRASHEDRDRVVELLRVSAGDGRLTADELDERLELAMTARTYGELAKLVADLPAAGSVAPSPAPRAKDVVRLDCGSGHILLVTRPGIVVDTDDVVVRSGHIRVRTPWSPDVPEVLRIEVSGKVGSGHFIARPALRTFWQWLTRQPRPYEIAAG